MKAYTLAEIEPFAIELRDCMFPRNGRAFHTLNEYDRTRHIKGAIRVIDLMEKKNV